MSLNKLLKEFKTHSSKEQAKNCERFFKTGKGEYGEGDVFLGIKVPVLRKLSKEYFKEISLHDILTLLTSKYHEERQIALFILVLKYEKLKNEKLQKEIFNIYIKHTSFINNWDLVDCSAGQIVGHFLTQNAKEKKHLKKWVKSTSLWERRIAIIATFYWIKKCHEFEETFEIAALLLNDKEDLIHKAVGWMLREVGNINQKAEEAFLEQHYKTMPRTMLRYAIEKFNETKRQKYLKGLI